MAKVILTLGADISTDVIYPGRYMATVLPSETPQYCFADMTEFNTKLKTQPALRGGIIVGGKNFGCGSSREQAASTLKGYDVVIVAESFARIFLQNSINLGLRLVEAPGVQAREGDDLEITPTSVVNTSTGKSFAIVQMPKARQAIIDAGGLIPYSRKLLVAQRKK